MFAMRHLKGSECLVNSYARAVLCTTRTFINFIILKEYELVTKYFYFHKFLVSLWYWWHEHRYTSSGGKCPAYCRIICLPSRVSPLFSSLGIYLHTKWPPCAVSTLENSKCNGTMYTQVRYCLFLICWVIQWRV